MQLKKAVQKINTYYVTNGYAKTTAQAYMRLGKELLEYLEQAGLEGTETDLQDWLTLKMRTVCRALPCFQMVSSLCKSDY